VQGGLAGAFSAEPRWQPFAGELERCPAGGEESFEPLGAAAVAARWVDLAVVSFSGGWDGCWGWPGGAIFK